MNDESGKNLYDKLKLGGSAALVVAGLWAFYFFADYSLLLRVIVLLIIFAGSVTVMLTTAPGRQLWRFVADARMELRKVVWPTREETVQTTIIVIIMVLVLGIVLWLFDALLMTILRFLTGRGAG